MAKKRLPPAYQEFAANILAQFPFRTMSLQDRGLFYTMRLECWVNKQLPSDTAKLARVLGLAENEVVSSLPNVMPFYEIDNGFIVCPELENYRLELEERKQRQSQAGKEAVSRINSKRRNKANDNLPAEIADDSLDSLPDGLADKSPDESHNSSLIQNRLVQNRLNQFSKEKDSYVDSFVQEMNDYESDENNSDDTVYF